MIMNNIYQKQVALLIRIIPLVYKIKDFAIHGGTAINLFHKNMPRYSVDIDLTYVPIAGREESLCKINDHLFLLEKQIQKAIPNVKTQLKPKVWKLQCNLNGATVKIEVNGTKRGLLGDIEEYSLCSKASMEFGMGCKARLVSYSQLYGGKIAAALSRQHPRDLFDYWHMEINSFDQVKDGLVLALLGSDKPIVESLNPNEIDQKEALENQFEGMSSIPFSYDDYEKARLKLKQDIRDNLSQIDKEFFISFEEGNPQWDLCIAGDLSLYPSVKWKLENILKLRNNNQAKYLEGIQKLKSFLFELK